MPGPDKCGLGSLSLFKITRANLIIKLVLPSPNDFVD